MSNGTFKFDKYSDLIYIVIYIDMARNEKIYCEMKKSYIAQL